VEKSVPLFTRHSKKCKISGGTKEDVMKKLLMTLVVLVTSSVLFACGEKAEFKRIKKYSPTTELATSTTSQEVTEKDKLDKLK